MPTLRNKVALITGAARGIGADTARALAAKGAKLVLIDLDAAPLQALVTELGDDVALAAVADVCDLPAMQRAVDAGVAKFGGIDLVLANAGIASYGSVSQVDPATFKRVLDINILGAFHTVRAALPSVIERKGYILVVSSLAAFTAAPGLAAYCASKAGVEHFASALHLELAHLGVAVGSAHMSWIDTPLVQDAKADLSAFNQLLAVLPGPLGKTTSVQACVDAFVHALSRRKRRVYVPRWVGPVGWFKAVVTSRIGDRAVMPHIPRILPLMDEEVAALGRSTSARNVALDDVAVDPS
ncbi:MULTISPECIES: SDR family oxidoreductase [Rhodococcus]|jgi:NAD(P)-dependent dehydrogenase (short-subunit alcohol dehydrogenase family)|uniref:SDR family oxidoreductase n=1 Tax=Rhodococcus oxybenzonivorans TaxID=1990687 RepID=A0AAE5A9C2_9NOCA|nr:MULTISPECIES: SDR family oxidoreductase [Rhodococcus]MDV7241743.1 SDR family oxidoreductase [Rhodococcus oxybenzonivorans]MDV7268687.1 SDR family oxidoreductase [Rhodococcus oxybenzonivorans]MDV7273723.1 SDR family oxidoreductase [Rhodococcus oxybenzonivorans]MDV7334025.1 SDR family oxidoreductase [Rhodococcus oxybenzonivorans]MDV7343444.1 SDR family oxidoreductase [Rhodococcus oxybenzonivorans]